VIEEVVMTATMHEPSTTESARNGIAARLLVPGFWGTVSIVAMWLAVLFDGVFGGDMVFSNQSNPAGGPTIIGSVVPVALFACLATISVARRAFRGRDAD
jgi:hypothetical protein